MPQPVLTRLEVESMVLEALNLSKNVAYGVFDGSPLYKIEFIREMIFQSDIEVVKAIARSGGHPRRNEYALPLSTFSTPGVRIPLRDTHHHLGEVISVDITRADAKVVYGNPAPAAKITEWLLDKPSYGGDDCIDGYYDIVDNDFIFTGTSAIVRVLNVAPHVLAPPDANLYSPFEYKVLVFRLTMAELLKKDASSRERASEYAIMAGADISEILGKTIMPTVQGYQQGR